MTPTVTASDHAVVRPPWSDNQRYVRSSVGHIDAARQWVECCNSVVAQSRAQTPYPLVGDRCDGRDSTRMTRRRGGRQINPPPQLTG
ncbi:hypothetical protein [Mycolicibacter virginiensis]|uniref:hypothetical protein n=1 Tax=Mycolicibacter virginiensis TaxID=1795032 RepID=UPI003D9B5D9C